VKWLAEWGMRIAPFYIPLMLGFVGLNFYLNFRASRAHKKPSGSKRKIKHFKENK
jgi:hypothetical protein